MNSNGRPEIVSFTTAANLPDEWDVLAGENIFLRKRSLLTLEATNPCEQRYYLFSQAKPDSLLVTYRLKLDILTYSFLSLKLPVTIVGIPCSVSKPGYHLGKATKGAVWQVVEDISGAKLVLNADDDLAIPGLIQGTTLPTCKLAVRWTSFSEYLAAMRSHYRYRLKKALARWQEVQVQELANTGDFDEEMYQLYLQVYQKSEFKLEQLGIEFFRTFPARIIKFSHQGRTLAFVQLLENGDELIFVLGGFDYTLNLQYDIYLNILLEIVRRGIDGRFRTIDLGQTAEDTKLKLGSLQHRKYMYFGHANPMVNFFVSRYPELLSYREKDLQFNVFGS